MYMLDVGAEILHRLLRRFAGVAEGVLHVPESREIVAGERIEHIAELVGIGEGADRLDQQRYAGLLRRGQHPLQHRHHRGALILVRTASLLRPKTHVGDAQALRGVDIIRYLRAVFFKHRLVGNVVPGINAGYRKPGLGHLAVRRVRPRGVEDAVLLRELRLVYIMDLYAREAAVLGDGAEILPCMVVPSESRK